VGWLALVSLIISYVFGQVNPVEKDQLQKCELLDGSKIEWIRQGTFAVKKGSHVIGYLAEGSSQGYGGPLNVAVLCDSAGNVKDIEVIKNNETYSYFIKIKSKGFFEQFKGKPTNQGFQLLKDIDGVSGATVSSQAFSEAIRKASHRIAVNVFNQEVEEPKLEWVFGRNEWILLIITIIGVLSILLKNKILKYISLGLSIVFIGFMFNASISLSHFGRLFLGYFPDIHRHLMWWIMMGSSILFILIIGKNLYCNALCPFHAVQLILSKISGLKWKFPPSVQKVLIKMPLFLLWVSLHIIFLSKNPTIASYEPFALLFSLDGYGIQWYILPFSLIGAIFIPNFFCNYFCPVGATLRFAVQKRKLGKDLLGKRNLIPKQETSV